MRASLTSLCLLTIVGCSPSELPIAAPPVDVGDPVPADAEPVDDADLPDAASPAPAWTPAAVPWTDFPARPFRPRGPLESPARRLVTAPDGQTIYAINEAQIDVVDATDPQVIATLLLPDVQAFAAGNTLALAATGADVDVFDVAAPRAPEAISRLTLPVPPTQIVLSADEQTAYAMRWSSENANLWIIDLRDPRAPTVQSARIDGLGGLAPRVDGAVVTVEAEDLVVRDLSTPAAPRILGRLDDVLDHRVEVTLSADGRRAYVRMHSTILVVDIEGAAPRLLGQLPVRGYCPIVELTPGTIAFIDDATVHMVDVSAPDLPVIAGTWNLPRTTCALAVLPDGRLLAGDHIVDPRRARAPATIQGVELETRVVDVELSADGRHAFVGAAELSVIAVEAPDVALSQIALPDSFETMHVTLTADGETAYVASGETMSVLDVRDPLAPVALGAFNAREDWRAWPMEVAVSSTGEMAFLVTEGGGGMAVLDVRDPGAIRVMGEEYIRHTSSIVATPDDSIVFVGDPYENGLVVFDVADPTRPRIIPNTLPVGVTDLALTADGQRMVALGRTRTDAVGVIADVRDPADIEVLATFGDDAGATSLQLSADGQTIYYGHETGGLHIVDASDPRAPREIGAFDATGPLKDVAVSADGHTAVMVAGKNWAHQVQVADLGAAPTLEPLGEAGGWRRYRLRWTDLHPGSPEEIAWHADAGRVEIVDIDQANHTAIVEWAAPSGDLTLSVAVGNHHYYRAARVTTR